MTFSKTFSSLVRFFTSKMFLLLLTTCIIATAIGIGAYIYINKLSQSNTQLNSQLQKKTNEYTTLTKKQQETLNELIAMKNDDQFVRNEKLDKEIKDIQKTYKDTVVAYEDLLKLKELTKTIGNSDKLFAEVLNLLSQRNYISASAKLVTLKQEISAKRAAASSAFAIPDNVTVDKKPPSSGYKRQIVETAQGKFMVDIIAADLNTTKVIVDTASDATCKNDCPVKSLGEYAARSGAIAGINGPYFCPESYPSCADKKNSFDTLLMNKNKVYFNSENNVYSVVPVAVFSGNSARFMGRSMDWGRDTGVDAVIANQPLMLLNSNIVFGGDAEVKRSSRGPRSFIASAGSTAYIGIVHNANVAEAAIVLKEMGIDNALNLDSGGSTALWNNGRYIAGPGRNLPFGILFVRK
jgi:exopolysaccharide biosynthesis protein